ncbi:MAG: hypothetical protein IK070_00795 [Clostridia bacterium]|nr:hypothetical protein [Clostridia bacterium]
MKRFFYVFTLIMLCCTFVLSACGKKGLDDNPATNAQVSGNGGFAVVKGDYLYYTNGYDENYTENYTSTSDNKFGSVTFGAIYRTKLSNGEVQYNEDGTLKSSQVVVSKLVGYEKGGFYIFGDYIYYGTPLMEKETSGTLRSDLVSFCRTKIDGTDTKEKLYVSTSAIDREDWKMYSVDGNVYLVVVEDDKNIVSVEINSKGKTSKKTLVENVTSYALYEGNIDSNSTKYVYFTKELSESAYSGNQFGSVNFVSGIVENFRVSDTTYEVIALKNHKVYYSTSTPIMGSDEKEVVLKYQSIDTPFDTTQNNATKFGYSAYTEYAVASYNGDIVVMRDSSENMVVRVGGVLNSHAIEASSRIVGFVGDYLYYVNTSSKLRKVQITYNSSQEYVLEDAFENEKEILTDVFDANGNNMYVFAKYTAENETTHYYLNKITGSDARFVGVFAPSHAPAPLDEDSEDMWIK